MKFYKTLSTSGLKTKDIVNSFLFAWAKEIECKVEACRGGSNECLIFNQTKKLRVFMDSI